MDVRSHSLSRSLTLVTSVVVGAVKGGKWGIDPDNPAYFSLSPTLQSLQNQCRGQINETSFDP